MLPTKNAPLRPNAKKLDCHEILPPLVESIWLEADVSYWWDVNSGDRQTPERKRKKRFANERNTNLFSLFTMRKKKNNDKTEI